jgi:diguanylate cyclase (GGDEF)-like protein
MVADIRARLENCPELPSLPAVAVRILNLCQQENPELTEIAKLLAHDPALAAKLLRLTNSPAYGLKREVSTVSHATMILGLNAIRTLALSFSLVKNLQQNDKHPVTWFWKRSLMSAVAARELAVACGCLQSEEAFLGALLQDIGVLALRQLREPQYEEVSSQAGANHGRLIAAEQELFGADHAEIGGWLCARWKLPPVLGEAVRSSHTAAEPPAGTHPDVASLIRVVAVSGLVADIWLREDNAAATSEARAAGQRLLGLPNGELDAILLRVAENSEEVATLFEVAIDSQEQLTAILDRAKETLFLLALEAARKASSAQETIDQLESKAKSLEQAAHRDGLTGLYNRAFFDRELEKLIVQARIAGTAVSVVIADIDHFKAVNDTHGHLAGDRVLAGVAHVLGSQLRPHDIAARYGGEEFVLILVEAGLADAQVVAERMRASVQDARHEIDGGKSISVTISAGCATLLPQATATKETLLAAADAALYAAKRSGRNRIVSAEALHAAAPTR